MSSSALPGNTLSSSDPKSIYQDVDSSLTTALRYLASLKLTISMFLLGMVVVFVGSLAQARRDVWLVVDQYFRTYVAWIDIADLFPPGMFPQYVNTDWESLGNLRYIPFPGGWTIGWVLLVNLLAAHYLRFKIRATGGKRFAGFGIMAIGGLLTWAVVYTGNHQVGVESANTLLDQKQIWYLMLGVLGIASVIPIATAIIGKTASSYERILQTVIGIGLGSVLMYFLIGGEDAELNLSSMRILWQLLKGTACAIVILVGSNLLFAQRGGIVVLHIGVALLMFSELQVGFYAKESLMTMSEGQTIQFARDVRSRELAVMSREGGKDRVVAIPENLLAKAAKATSAEGKTITQESLPFHLRIDRYMRNSSLRARLPDDPEFATSGLGTFATPVERPPVDGMNNTHDASAIQITLIDKQSGDELETLLCSQNVSEHRAVPIAEVASLEDDDYQFYLRFHRNYKDYEVELLDTERKDYIGTSTPRDYRSQIKIRDTESGNEEEFTIWMNNPLRYNGETFYQTGHEELPNGTEITTLSVVKNTGWMLPYIACMILAVGMFSQFGQTLRRYLARVERGKRPADPKPNGESSKVTQLLKKPHVASEKGTLAAESPSTTNPYDKKFSSAPSGELIFVAAVLLLSLGWLGSKLRTPVEAKNEMHVNAFADLPVAWKGRSQPVQSFAQSELLMMSHKSTFEGELASYEINKEVREDLKKTIQYAWPDKEVDLTEIDQFEGEYEQWIEKIASLTDSSKEITEERIRDLLVERMNATRWLLDVVARFERGGRHPVIRIDNDQVLSLLGLEKRPGLTYSPVEIEGNLDSLRRIYEEGMRLQIQDRKAEMSAIQRRVVSLFQNMGRVEALKNMFLIDRTETLTEAIVQTWWVQKRLGTTQAIMAIPTGLKEDRRSFETLLSASAIYNLNLALKDAGVTSREELEDYMKTTLPQQMVSDTLKGSYSILKGHVEEVAQKAGRDVGEEDLKQRATDAASSPLFEQQPYMQGVFQLIADAPAGSTVDDILKSVTEEQALNLANERLAEETFRIFQELQADENDPRLKKLQTKLRALAAVSGADSAETMNAMTTELFAIALDDLEERSGDLLYSSEETETFETATASMIDILKAWEQDDVQKFNGSVPEYKTWLTSRETPHLSFPALRIESFFNRFEPQMKAMYLYLPVLLLAFFSWIGWSKPLRRAGFWLMLLAFVVHTVALGMRMYISGRPPVTNLYSSAIFIGWGTVAACFFIEPLLKNGIGNIIGSSVGMGTLMIAHYLARDEGDTLGVMQAVLDTTFWLATHVVCITLGYAATFLAGAFGIAYIINSKFGADTKSPEVVQLGKITYGTLCFALFLSLIGTILGGLWADDSWGRFWGWDPKENGAMLIVMWNAVILHARWDKMIRDYGTAVLAIFGNVVTAWSWFGVNELSAGLHNYGFTEGRLLALKIFVASQLALIVIAVVAMLIRNQSTNKMAT